MSRKLGHGLDLDDRLDDEIRHTLEERAQYFSVRWFGRLFRAQLSLADTFWTGMFGVLLVLVPLMFALAFLAKAVISTAGIPVLSALSLLLGLYWAVVTRSVIVVSRRTPDEIDGWRGAARVFAVLMTLGALGAGLGGLL